jgi:hypothetical protein
VRCSLLTGFQSAIRNRKSAIELAEGVGFEPTRACALPVFKTGAINHSTTPPRFRAAGDFATARPMSNRDEAKDAAERDRRPARTLYNTASKREASLSW